MKRLSSYAGIRGFLDDLHRKIGRALGLRQAGTPYVKSGYLSNAGDLLPGIRLGNLLNQSGLHALSEPIDLSQTRFDRLLPTRGMFDMVFDLCLQVVDRCRDGLRLLSEGQLTKLLCVPLMPTSDSNTSVITPRAAS